MQPSWKILRANTWISLIALALLMLASDRPAAEAVTLYWDSDGNASGNNTTTGAGLGGMGTGLWGGASWFNGAADVAWTDGNDAVFWGPTSGTISLTTTRSVNSLAFKTNGYVLQTSTLNLAGSSVTVDTGAASITSIVSGAAGLVKNGGGALHLTNVANTYTGGTTVNGGVLGIVSGSLGALPASPAIDITLNNGGTLRYNADGMALNVNRQILLGAGGGALNTNGNNGGVSGVISGSSLTKIGAGTLTLSNNNTYTGGTTISTGTLLVNNAIGSGTGTGPVTVNAAGTLGGNGTVLGNVTNSGIASPGTSVGALHLGGTYTQTATGRLDIELASLASYDRLILSGAATLSGTLAVSLTSGFMPQAGNTFEIVTATGLGGTQFTTTNLPTLSGSLGWSVNYDADSVTLAVTTAGDFNNNGKVDGADYVVWRKGLGTTFQQSDYGVWRSNFGTPGAAAAASVPEPAACSLVGLAALTLLARRRLMPTTWLWRRS
jgi:autotransporter-associated beta strand protein